MKDIKDIIYEAINEFIEEHRYQFSATPVNSKTQSQRELGINPLSVDNGGHSVNDILAQPSTVDVNGANFRTDNKVVLSDNKFIIYKIKNFGTDRITATIDLFGKGSNGEKNFRKEIDIMNGAARRNGRYLMYRTITSASNQIKSEKTQGMSGTFWEFSYDGGNTWYIMKPNGIQTMQQTKLIKKQ